jgi:type I restriction enzyme S subunit
VKWKTLKLGDLYAANKETVDPSGYLGETFHLYSVPAYDSRVPDELSGDAIGSVKQAVSPNDVLLCRIVPHIRRAWVVGKSNGHRLIASSEWIVMRHEDVYPEYLRQFLLSNEFHSQFMMSVAGVGGSLLRARPSAAADIEVPVPPMEEQRRIAAILDKADALRQKRRLALQKLDEFTDSLFIEMFGNPGTSHNVFPIRALVDLLGIPLRNGLSPSHSGAIRGKVLTLSAITGQAFNSLCVKESTFQTEAPSDQTVDANDLLIYRGNGSIDLVGKAYFPRDNMPDVLFPDTMIAARIDPDKVEREFIEYIWNSSFVRKQIVRIARTTNGTFKVNQHNLEKVQIVSPPLALQRKLSKRIRNIYAMKTHELAHLEQMDTIFASLQHRAFRGEL